MFVESLEFSDPPTTKWRFFKFLTKLNGNHILMANFSKLRKFFLNCIIWAKVSELIEHSSYEKAAFTITGSPDRHFLKFWHFNFSNFQTTFVKIFTKKLPGFKIDFESTDKVLPLHQYLWSEISRQWNNGPLNFFWNLHGRAFCFLNFVKWGKY